MVDKGNAHAQERPERERERERGGGRGRDKEEENRFCNIGNTFRRNPRTTGPARRLIPSTWWRIARICGRRDTAIEGTQGAK